MKKCLITSCSALVVCVLLLASTAWSDDVTPPIAAGAKAALFTFSGLSNLGAGAFNGGIGGKYYVLDPLALRASLLFALADQGTPAPAAGGTAGDANAWSVGLNVGAEFHLLKTRVSPYVGGAVGFVSSSTSEKDAVPTGTPQYTVTNAPVTINGTVYPVGGFNFNIAALAGVEFFIIKELSLSAEYRLGYSVTAPYDQKTTAPGGATIKSGAITNFGIYAIGALTLGFYF
jgi:hypothetical protein